MLFRKILMVIKEMLYMRRNYMKNLAGNIIQIAREIKLSLQNEIKGGPFASQTIERSSQIG